MSAEQPESNKNETKKCAITSSRAPKIYTRVGDFGFTSLLGSSAKVPKWDVRVKAYGAVDELNAHLGQILDVINAMPQQKCATGVDIPTLRVDITNIQRTLFVMSSWLSRFCYVTQDKFRLTIIDKTSVKELEVRIDQMTCVLPVLKNFILLQGTGTSAIHIARTICRRAEGQVAEAIYDQRADDIEQYVIIMEYMNRLSDWLYTLARFYAFSANQPEILA